MSSNDALGPGIGSLLAGMQYGATAVGGGGNVRREIALENELEETRERLLKMSARFAGVKSLAEGMVDELEAEDAGDPAARRLSNPANRELRMRHVERVEEAELHRLSGGRVHFNRKPKP